MHLCVASLTTLKNSLLMHAYHGIVKFTALLDALQADGDEVRQGRESRVENQSKIAARHMH